MHFRYSLLVLLLLGACDSLDKPTIPLYLAVQRGDIDQVERHIHWQADINTPFANGRYPLHEAAEKGRVIILRSLLKHGTNIDAQDNTGASPIDLAILAGKTQAAEILLEAGAKYDASQLLLQAAQKDVSDRDIVRFLARHGANLEIQDDAGNTPLLLAVANNNHRLAQHLVEQGANVNAQRKDGLTVLQVAQQTASSEIQQLLQRQGAQ